MDQDNEVIDSADTLHDLRAKLERGECSHADVLNLRLLETDRAFNTENRLGTDNARGARRIAVLSLLFNWPSTGGGIVHTAELCSFLNCSGYEVCHFYAVYKPWNVGSVAEALPYPSHALVFDETTWALESVVSAFEDTVSEYAPDCVIVTDSWNSKPHLARAAGKIPYFLRLAALECICPLNNVRLLPRPNAPPEQCLQSQLATPDSCVDCVRQNSRFSGWLHEQERQFSRFGSPEYTDTLQSAFREAAGVFAVNPEIAESCRSFTKAVHVIPSGFDASRFEDSRALDDTDGIFRILFPGLIDEYMKGFHVIREACQQLWLERQDFELHVTADESANCDLPFIRARGWQSQQDLPGLMSACDVVVVPTIAQEALGRTAVEAMGAERPVIASRIGGLPYTVTENETGLLVEPGDAADLKRAIVRLMTDTPFAVQLGGNGRRRFLSEFTWDAVIQNKYRPLFRALRSSR